MRRLAQTELNKYNCMGLNFISSQVWYTCRCYKQYNWGKTQVFGLVLFLRIIGGKKAASV